MTIAIVLSDSSDAKPVKPPIDFDRFKQLTIIFDFKKTGYATTMRHGYSIDARLHRPIRTLAGIEEGESFKVYIEKDGKALLLIRTSELDTPEKVQSVFRKFGAVHLLTPDFTRLVAEDATYIRSLGPRSPRLKKLGGSGRQRARRH